MKLTPAWRGRAVLALALVLASCRARPPAGDAVWAEVNGQPILRSAVERHFQQQTGSLPDPLTEDEALARKLRILSELIQTEILWQKAVQAGHTAGDAEIEVRFQQLRAPFSEDEFQKQLGAQRLSAETLKADLRREIVIRKLLDQVVASSLEVSRKELEDYYHDHTESFRLLETQFHVAHLLVTPRPDFEIRNLRNEDASTDAAARQKVQQLLTRLRAGEDFGLLARNHSEDPDSALSGGDLGFFPESALAQAHPALRSFVFQLAPGEVGGPVRTGEGYVLVHVIDRIPPGQRELSDPQVETAIRERLLNMKRQLAEAAFVENARTEARVTNYLARQILEGRRLAR